MTDHNKKLVKLFIRILITAGLLTVVFSRINLQQFWQIAKAARWQLLVIVWILAVIGLFIRSLKMRLILKKQSCNVGINTLFGISAITALYGMIIPGPLSTSVKWYILKRNTGKGSNVLSSMMYNQLTEILVMISLGLVGLIVVNLKHHWKISFLCLLVLLAIAAICMLSLNRSVGIKISGYMNYVLRLLPDRLYKKTAKIPEQLRIFQTVDLGFHLKAVFITILSGFVTVIIYVLAAKSAGINVPTGVFVWQCALIYILGRFPISVANLGIRELALIETLAEYNVAAPDALLMSMIIFSTYLLIVAIGAVCQITWAIRTKKSTQS